MTKKEFEEVEAGFLEYLKMTDPLMDEDAKYIRAHSRFPPATTNELEMFHAGRKIGYRHGLRAVCRAEEGGGKK